MKINEIVDLVCASKLNDINNDIDFKLAIASDTVADVTAFDNNDVILVTGKADISIIKAAELMNIDCIILSRGKVADVSVIDIATNKGISLLRSKYGTFTICGLLYENGIRGGMSSSLLNF